MNIAIVGGGFTGLSAAYHLSKKKHKVTVFEKNSNLGGLAASIKLGDAYLEKFVHHFFQKDEEAISLVSELGEKDKLIWRKPQNAILYKDKIFPFDTPIDLIKFLPVDFHQRLLCGINLLYLKSQKNYHLFEKVTAETWLKNHFRKKNWEIIWKPLLKKKFWEEYKKISMAWFWARIFYRSKRLGYFRGGLEMLIQELVKRIVNAGSSVLTNKKIDNLKPLITNFDKVIISTSPTIFLKIASDQLPTFYKNKLRKIYYNSVVSLILLLKRKLNKNIYWLNINDYKIPFLVCVEHTNFIDRSEYDGKNLVYLEAYFRQNNKNLLLEDKQLLDKWLPSLVKINSQFNKNWVCSYKIFRERYAQPVVEVGYHKIIPDMVTPLKNVYFASMCQVYPQDRGVNFALKIGRQVAEKINN